MEILILKLNHKVRGILGFSTPLLNCPKFYTSRFLFYYFSSLDLFFSFSKYKSICSLLHQIDLFSFVLPRFVLFLQIMASSSGSVAGSGTENRGFIKPTGDNLDIFWKWNSYTDASKKTIVCDFCFHPSKTCFILMGCHFEYF